MQRGTAYEPVLYGVCRCIQSDHGLLYNSTNRTPWSDSVSAAAVNMLSICCSPSLPVGRMPLISLNADKQPQSDRQTDTTDTGDHQLVKFSYYFRCFEFYSIKNNFSSYYILIPQRFSFLNLNRKRTPTTQTNGNNVKLNLTEAFQTYYFNTAITFNSQST